MGTMQPERLVRLQGLTARPELNGRIGQLVRLANGEDGAPRWAVQLRGDDGRALVDEEPKLLKAEKLVPVSNIARRLYDANFEHDTARTLHVHGGTLPISFFATHHKVLKELPTAATAHARLDVLQAAALELAVRDGDAAPLRLSDDGLRVGRAAPLPPPADAPAPAPADGAVTAIHLPAGGAPKLVRLTTRADHLHVAAEAVHQDCTVVGLFLPEKSARAKSNGSKSHTPTLYYDAAAQQQPHTQTNALAGRLAGHEIAGDALYAKIDGKYGDEELTRGESVSLKELELALLSHEKIAGPLGCYAAKVERPLLGRRALPRDGSWACYDTGGLGYDDGEAHVGPKHKLWRPFPSGAQVVLQEWTQKMLRGQPGGQRGLDVGAEGEGTAWTGSARVTLRGDAPIEEATPKTYPKKADAENAACARAIDTLAARYPPPPPSLEIVGELVRIDGGAADDTDVHPQGTRIALSYTLTLEEGGAVLEKQSRVQVAIGGGVLLEEVEAALSELNAGPAAFGARARYHGAEVGLRLDVTVETVLPPKEERVDFAGDGSVGAARRELLDELIAAARPSSIVDVGCGEATLLCRVLDRALADAPGATPPQLVGVEALGPPLRKAQAAIEKRLQAHADGANARVALYRGALEGLVGGEALELPYGIDLVTCVEVVEHLDPAPLAAFGDAVLGRCAPRVAIVTTPNKEYNVCFRTEGSSKGQFNPLERPPPLAALELRNSDHRFEWTRAEFKEWADGLAARYGYTVRFRGAGGGDWHADPPYDESVTGEELLERGVGPATQVAIFEATTEAPAPDAEAVAAWVGPAPERVWASL